MLGKEGEFREENPLRFENRLALSQKIDWLDSRQLGRSIRIEYPQEPPPYGETGSVLVGVVLPLNRENTSHLAILKNGEVLYLEPFKSSNQEKNRRNIEEYQEWYAPNDEPMAIEIKVPTGPDKDISVIKKVFRSDTNVSLANRRKDLSQVKADLEMGIRLAQEANGEDQIMKERIITTFNELMEREFSNPWGKGPNIPEDPSHPVIEP